VATGRLTVLSGPAGVGKSTVVGQLRRRDPRVWHSVSVTTRPKRPNEVEGTSMHFVSRETFEAMVADHELLEHAEYAGNLYGTPRGPVEEHLRAGDLVLLEIEIQGARQVREQRPDALLVFLSPPSWNELERRLRGRGTESTEDIRRRLDRARIELAAEDEFDVTIVSRSVADAAAELLELMQAPPTEP
jgi:guanylate kinase